MRQFGNEGRRAMRCGAPADTPGVTAQAAMPSAQCRMPREASIATLRNITEQS